MSFVIYTYYAHVQYLAAALIQSNLQKCFELPGVRNITYFRFLFAQAKKANPEIEFDVAVSVCDDNLMIEDCFSFNKGKLVIMPATRYHS